MRVEALSGPRPIIVLESEREDLCSDQQNVEAVMGGPIQDLEEAMTTTAHAACPAGAECCQLVAGGHSVERHEIDDWKDDYTLAYKLRVRHDQDDATCRDRAGETFTGLRIFLGAALAQAEQADVAFRSTVSTGLKRASEIMDTARLQAEAAETAAQTEAAATKETMLASSRKELIALLPALTDAQAQTRN